MRAGHFVALALAVGILASCHPRLRSTPLAEAARHAETDIARGALEVEVVPLSRDAYTRYATALDHEAALIRGPLFEPPAPSMIFDALQRHFFGPEGFAVITSTTAPETMSLAAVLEARRGTCVGLTIVYLALAQRLGLPAHAVGTPAHLFVRVRLEDRPRNVELTEGGREIDDDTYRRRYKMDDASVAAGVFMRDLQPAEVIAHLLSNQAVAWSAHGQVEKALARADDALALAPRLVAVWYNRGLDLMNAGRLPEARASFTRAIELYPSDAQAHNNRGLTMLKLGDVEGARTDFKRALELDPGLTEAEENLRRLAGEGSPP